LKTTDKILLGIEIIRKYEPDANFACEHEVLYFGTCDDDDERMSSEDRQRLADLDWFEEYESWAHQV
jgi:hypothetical protein